MSARHSSTTRRLFLDSVFRRWALWHWRYQWPVGEVDVSRRLPPYIALSPQHEQPEERTEKTWGAPVGKIAISLFGEVIEVEKPADLFDRAQNPLTLHGFAWAAGLPPEWAAALWNEWSQRHGIPKPRHPAWSPEITARRALALLQLVKTHHLSGGVKALALHAKQIVSHLQYRGEKATGSVLALQGHALARIGLELGMSQTAQDGFLILQHEAHRIILPSGLTAEGSTLAHLRLAHAYTDAWLAARQYNRLESAALESAASRLLGVIPLLTLPGEMPLVGDAQGPEPASAFSALCPGAPLDGSWIASLDEESRMIFEALRDSSRQTDLEAARADGWLRLDHGNWSGLWHVSPTGWPELPGLSHHDQGSFSLHYGSVPLFVDPGMGPKGTEDLYSSADVHNGIELDRYGLSPENLPAYGEEFRREIVARAPDLRTLPDGVSLDSDGFNHLGGPREASRRWQFEADSFTISEHIKGTGIFEVVRRLVTPLLATPQSDGSVLLSGPDDLRFLVQADVPALVGDGWRTTVNGTLSPVRVIEFVQPKASLPYRGRITVSRL